MMIGSRFAPLAAAALLGGTGLCGCGALLTGSDQGPPLAQLRAAVSQLPTTAIGAPYGELLWAMPFYLGPGDTEPIPVEVQSGHALAPIHGDFPSGFTLDVFEPPPNQLLNSVRFDDGTTAVDPSALFTFSIATVLVFDDVNGDQDFDLVYASNGAPTSAWGDGVTFAPDVLRGWMEHGAMMYVSNLPDPGDPDLTYIFANPEALRLGFQGITQCHLAGTAADTRFQVLASTDPLAVRLVEPTYEPVLESQPLWFDDVAVLPDCVP